MNNLSKAAELYGSFRAHMSTIILSIVAIFVIGFSVKTLINNRDYVETRATVNSANCKESGQDRKTVMYKCHLDLDYNTKNATERTKVNTESSTEYTQGDIISIGYNKNKPKDVLTNFKLREYGPIGAIIFMLIITSLSFVNLHYVRKYKSVARVEGVTGFISNVVRR
jgi:hypothetical protein